MNKENNSKFKQMCLSEDELEYLEVLFLQPKNDYLIDLLDKRYAAKLSGLIMGVLRNWVVMEGRNPNENDDLFWRRLQLAKFADEMQLRQEESERKKRKQVVR